ncbi:MAG: adenosylcobinamide-GDP ribazoletransferase [Desulfosarcinaceae bacterium]
MTVIPVPLRAPFSARAATPYFPVVGLLIGLLVCLVDKLALMFWPPLVASILDVTALALLSGALHLDGLADSADGLYGHRPREDALAIMKDSNIGAMGTVAVILCLAAKTGGIRFLQDIRPAALILVPAYARATVLFGMRFLPYGRPQGGTGHAFFQAPLKTKDFWAVLLLVPVSLVLGAKALSLNLGFIVLSAATLWFYRRRMGCITGDMLGAMIEVMEAGLFLILSAGMRP